MDYESLGARFSSCRHYRYSLRRRWHEGAGRVVFIGLNPSTADHRRDDPTVRRCVGFARHWGYRELELVNLFAFRTPSPKLLRACADPIGPGNDRWIRRACRDADRVVACWGNHGTYRQRAADVMGFIPDAHYLRMTANEQPAHPLYLPAGLPPRPLHPAVDSCSTDTSVSP